MGKMDSLGKGISIWDTFSHIPGMIVDNSTGDDACKSYEFYKDDVENLKYMGVGFFRNFLIFF